MAVKNLLIISFVFIFHPCMISSFGESPDVATCTPTKTGPNLCGESEDIMQCIVYPSPDLNCTLRHRRPCAVNHKVCFKIGIHCKPKCCDKWEMDSDGLCTVGTNQHEQNQEFKIKLTTPTVIGIAVVGVLTFMLVLLILVMICRRRRNRKSTFSRNHVSRTSHTGSEQCCDNTAFTVYNNDPPPYYVVMRDNLPEYTPRTIPPQYKAKEETMP